MMDLALRKYCVLTALALIFSITGLYGQELRVSLIPDTNIILIGDHLGLQLRVAYPADFEVRLPDVFDTLSGFEVLSRSEADTQRVGEQVVLSQDFTLTAFDSGMYLIRPLDVRYGRSGDSLSEHISTAPVAVAVLIIPVDTAQASVKPIKDPQDVGYSAKELMPWLAVALLLIALAYVLYRRLSRERPEAEETKSVHRIPPHETAMKRLARLEERKLWQQGEIKNYYAELSEILRGYIEEKFELPALESVTDDILRDLIKTSVSKTQRNHLIELLRKADLAKFAKFRPGDVEHMEAMETARVFVRETQAMDMPEEKNPADERAVLQSTTGHD